VHLCYNFKMGKKNNSYTASYRLKVISLAEQFRNRAAQSEFGILESNVRYWRKQKEVLKNAKSDKRLFRGTKAGKCAYCTHPDFSAAILEKKSVQIMRVYTVFPGVKGGRCIGLTTLPPSCTDCVKIWEPQPAGTLRACQGL
jgi:hypothetical protein